MRYVKFMAWIEEPFKYHIRWYITTCTIPDSKKTCCAFSTEVFLLFFMPYTLHVSKYEFIVLLPNPFTRITQNNETKKYYLARKHPQIPIHILEIINNEWYPIHKLYKVSLRDLKSKLILYSISIIVHYKFLAPGWHVIFW